MEGGGCAVRAAEPVRHACAANWPCCAPIAVRHSPWRDRQRQHRGRRTALSGTESTGRFYVARQLGRVRRAQRRKDNGMTSQASAAPAWRLHFDWLSDAVTSALSPAILLLVQRLGLAAIFFQSGRTKVEGLFTIPDTTV